MSREETRVTSSEKDHQQQTAAGEFRLERIVFIGRTYDEYLRMFDLTLDELRGRRILDCPAGACSFTAAANRNGIQVTAADIAYQFDAVKLEAKGLQDIGHAAERVEKVKEQFVWKEFDCVAGLRAERTKALTETIEDMRQHPERYVPATLPKLPFQDQHFDMTLSAHFLFMYQDQLDFEFHLHTLKELLRVSKEEIRIFPLVDQSSRRYEHMHHLIGYAENEGWKAEERKVDYEFQRDACSMLVLKREQT